MRLLLQGSLPAFADERADFVSLADNTFVTLKFAASLRLRTWTQWTGCSSEHTCSSVPAQQTDTNSSARSLGTMIAKCQVSQINTADPPVAPALS